MSLWAVLLTGLFAGGASCAAVQGGLLAGTLARRRPEPAVAGSGRRKGPRKTAPASAAPARWDDAVPVGAFLAGKLASHVVLGAALGLAGNAMQIGPRARAYMQIAAGLVMVLLALNLVGLKAVQALVPPHRRRGPGWCGAAAGGATGSPRPCWAWPPCSSPAG